MTTEEIIKLLQQDMRDEHQAIIQYLGHAYAMPEGEVPGAIEAVARDEMRHLDWLADAITELGGDPTMERTPPDRSAGTPAEQMRKNVGLEDGAIAQYRAHVAAIPDAKIQRLLTRILNDELAHRDEFVSLAHIAETELATEPAAEPAELKPPARVAAILNQGIRHEYTVILQYLYHSFMAEGKELAEELQNVAINEMQHMGWLSEELAEKGGVPEMEHTELVLTADPEDGLKADIAVERAVTNDYTTQLNELADEGTRDLVARIRDHEIYHEAVFTDLLAEHEEEEEAAEKAEDAAKAEPPKPSRPEIPSVGSLIDKS
ncbi:MAG: ferritin-like domain-containing protein [Chloroflexi bacterium]|nr:ferritin-like domain-containing protein [Chloroflexota bacterium]